LRNSGTLDARTVAVSDTLPAGLALEPDSLFFSAGQGEIVGNAVRWQGPVGRRGLVIVTYSGRVSPTQRTPLVNTASVRDDFAEVVECQAVVRVSNLVFLPVVRAGRQATDRSLPKNSEYPGR
jgi:hypothetical protein